ncbi:MAG: phosphate ABC transporter permease [Leptolyngbyaceae bacterium]|nr:phosphate ABC transporter permease [Leptolyngbyaceae bacterium]
MLIPLSRKKFEELIPLAATSNQYRYFWGRPADLLRRILFSLAGVFAALLLGFFFREAGESFEVVMFIVGAIMAFYWLWAPVYLATRRNREYRRFQFSGFWSGEVVDTFVTEELKGTRETVDKRGDLVVIEDREKLFNLEVGDDTGFVATVKTPLKKEHRSIRVGDWAEMVVMSNRPDLSRIMKISDVFVSDANLWVSDYPYLRRDAFMEVSKRIRRGYDDPRYDDPQSDDAPYGKPRYGKPRYNDPRYGEPQYDDARYREPRYDEARYDDYR